MSPFCQRLTLRLVRLTVSIIDSHGFVDCSVLRSAPRTPRRVTVNVSSRPSRSDAAAPGCDRSSSVARPRSRSSAAAWSSSAHAARSRRLTWGRSRSGRWSSTLRSLWRTQRCTGVWTPSTSRIALRSALAPSITHSTPCSTSRPRSMRLASSVVATVAFSVEPSHSPSGCLMPSVSIPSATTQQRPLLDAVEQQHRQAQIDQRAAHQRDQVLARARDELTRHRRLARRPLDLLDVLADRFPRARVAARRNAREHPLEHDVGERVALGEVTVRPKLDPPRAAAGAGPRPLDRHAPPTERHLAALMAVTHRPTARIVLALWAHDLIDLGLHELVQHPQADADAQRQQPLLRGAGQLAQRLLHPLRQPHARQLIAADLIARYGPHRGGSSCPRWTCSHSPRSQRERTRRENRRLQVLRATGQPPREWIKDQIIGLG